MSRYKKGEIVKLLFLDEALIASMINLGVPLYKIAQYMNIHSSELYKILKGARVFKPYIKPIEVLAKKIGFKGKCFREQLREY